MSTKTTQMNKLEDAWAQTEQPQGNSQSNSPEQKAELTKLPLSTILRFLGAFFVAASGVIYLLQGLVDANMDLRYWAYLLLMLVLAGGGIFSHKFMHDDKGARMFFGLATLLVPIQFTQLGAMLFEWINPVIAGNTIISLGQLTLFAGLSLIMGGMATFGGLSILTRPHAKKLTAFFLLFNGLLLLPERSVLPVLLLSVLMASLYFMLDFTIFKRDLRFSLMDGRAVKVIMSLPLMIVLARSGFNVSAELGIGLMVLQSAVVIQIFNSPRLDTGKLTKVLGMLSFVLFVWGWLLVASVVVIGGGSIFNISNDYAALITAIPLLLMVLRFDYQSSGLPLYRIAASIIFATYALFTWTGLNMFSIVLLSIASIAVLLYAIRQQSLALLSVSGLALLASLARVLSLSIGQIDINAWLGLAIAGVVLVASSSIIERYGKEAKNKFSDSVNTLKAWNY